MNASDPLQYTSSAGRFRLVPNRRTEATALRRWQRDLAEAVARNDLTLQFEPRIRIADGVVIGAEARVIWPHRRAATAAATDFAKPANGFERGSAIGGWALDRACAAAMGHTPSDPAWRISVNVSACQLAEGVLLRQLSSALEQSRLPAERLELAFAETILQQTGVDTLFTLAAIRDLGVSLALDDFGTGLASLAQLKRLPLTTLKLDRSLLQLVPQQRDDAVILRAIIQAGHALELEIVATDVQSEAQRGFLASAGCDAGQGSLFGHDIELLSPPSLAGKRITKA